MTDKKKIYDACKCIQRTCPDTTIDEALVKQIATTYRTLPSFEKTTYEHIYKKHYSLERNEFLRCRWKEYKAHFDERIFSPFMFPDVRDFHFYQGDIQFNPSLSVHKAASFKNHLKPGPGVDHYGQMPIPNELFMERGLGKAASKNRNEGDRRKTPKGAKHGKKAEIASRKM